VLIENFLYTGWITREFKSIGNNTIIKPLTSFVGGKYIKIGENSIIGNRVVLTAWSKHKSNTYIPQINIGNNVSIGDDSHITAINSITIGNNVLTGKKVTITDNSHGKSELLDLTLPPKERNLFSAGPVCIEDGVWIGDKVTILSNVHIGMNAIIGANAVVTKDIPANCIAVGIPAKVIKVIK
jgi:acetyltransferase-like isoleucine patch superfamily enzyme